MHYMLGYTTDKVNDFLLNLSLKGIARLNPYCIRQALPITPDILMQMTSFTDLTFSGCGLLVFILVYLFPLC